MNHRDGSNWLFACKKPVIPVPSGSSEKLMNKKKINIYIAGTVCLYCIMLLLILLKISNTRMIKNG